MSNRRTPAGEQQKATLREAAEAWERARTMKEKVPNEEGWRRLRNFQVCARADLVLALLYEIDALKEARP